MAEGGSKISDEEIVEMLKTLHLPVVKNEIKCPTKEFIVRVFECFLKDLQIDPNELRSFESLRHIDDGDDIYEESLLLILYAMTVNYITSPCGLNITLKDIIDPKPKRTKKNLYCIMIFWNYYIQKYARFHAIEKNFETEKKKAEDLNRQNELLYKEYITICNTLQNMQPNKSELLDAIQARKEKMQNYEKQMEEVRDENILLKEEITNINNQMGETDVNIVSAQKRLGELDQLILSSPERVHTEIQKLKDKIKTEDTKLKEKEAKLKDVEKKLRIKEETLKSCDKIMKKSKDVDKKLEHLRQSVKTAVSLQEQLDIEEDEVNKLQADLQRREESKALQRQQSCKAALNSKLQRDELTNVLQRLFKEEAKEKKTLEQLNESFKNIRKCIDEKSDEIIKTSHKIKGDKIKYKETIDSLISEFKLCVNDFKADCEAIIEEVITVFPHLEN